jgi:hypothetical protein
MLALALLSAAPRAFAQTPIPLPDTPSSGFEATPPPPPPPPSPPAAPATTTALPASMAPMAAAKSPDDMTGSLGFGVGVIGSTQIVGTQSQVAIKYWINDTLVLMPALGFALSKAMGSDSAWALAPQAMLLFVPFRSTSTRFLLGGGLGLSLADSGAAMSDTAIGVTLPIQAGVEHFFARWFSLGIAARSTFFTYMKTGDVWSTAFSINTAQLAGSLFFYTD